MPALHLPMSTETLAAASAFVGVVSFFFMVSQEVSPRWAAIISVIFGIILYSIGVVPIGLIVVAVLAGMGSILKMIFKKDGAE